MHGKTSPVFHSGRALFRGLPSPFAATASTRESDIQIRAISNRLREAFATHVAIHHTPKKGRIEIEYYGDDDLQRILDLLGLPDGE